MKNTSIALASLVLLALILGYSSMYVVSEEEQAFVTRFGEIKGGAKTEPGLYFKLPLSDEVRRFERRILEWDGRPSESITQDKKTIRIDTYARWRIDDPILFFKKLKDEDFARSRLSAILDGATRTAVSKHDLVEVIRSVEREEVLAADSNQTAMDTEQKLREFVKGRQKISNGILEESKPKVLEFGITLLDFRFKRINYSAKVQTAQFGRMIAARAKIAAEFRGKGAAGAEEWMGNKVKRLDEIQSQATLEERVLRGEADAEAARIYAEAYSSPQAQEFYRFIKTMESYEKVLTEKDMLILSTKSEFFNFLREINPASKAGPK